MSVWVKRVGLALAALALLALVFVVGQRRGSALRNAEVSALINQLADKDATVIVTRNKVSTLESMLKTSDDRAVELATTLAKLKDKPTEVRYVLRTETVVAASEPVVVVTELPESHDFTLENGVVVAEFDVDASKPEYTFTTHQLRFRGTLAIGEKSSAARFQMQSDANPEEWADLNVDLETTYVGEKRLVKPFANLGITGSLGPGKPVSGDLTGSLYLSWLHPAQCVDTLNLRASANTRTLKFGLDPVAYNIGCNIKGLSDLWIGAGASVDIHGSPTGDITIGTRL